MLQRLQAKFFARKEHSDVCEHSEKQFIKFARPLMKITSFTFRRHSE